MKEFKGRCFTMSFFSTRVLSLTLCTTTYISKQTNFTDNSFTLQETFKSFKANKNLPSKLECLNIYWLRNKKLITCLINVWYMSKNALSMRQTRLYVHFRLSVSELCKLISGTIKLLWLSCFSCFAHPWIVLHTF